METKKLYDGAWTFDEGGVRFFLIEGDITALLIDTGMAPKHVKELVATVTSKPVELINTHADRDHIARNGEFEWAYMHPSELTNYHKRGEKKLPTRPVWDGDVIDLGNRKLEIIHLPGHTSGSIAILDRDHRALYSGDPIQVDGNIFMFGTHRNIPAYIQGLERLWTIKDRFDVIYPCHAQLEVSPDVIPQLIDGAEKILAGKITPTEADMHGNRIAVYDIGIDRILGDPL